MKVYENSGPEDVAQASNIVGGHVARSQFFVYILASWSRVLYTGVTRDLLRRVHQHRLGQIPGFTQSYHVTRLVYFEETPSARSAFDRERQIKGWSREKKIRLIESTNAGWLDLAKDWLPTDER
jgi:putative endonuclease